MNIIKPIYLYLILFFSGMFAAKAQNSGQVVVTDDITHFWEPYDCIVLTTDSSLQYAYLNDLFIAKGPPD